MKQEKFFIATSTKIPKKGEAYECRRFTANPRVQMNCFLGRINFVLKLWRSNNVYVVIDADGKTYFLQVQNQ